MVLILCLTVKLLTHLAVLLVLDLPFCSCRITAVDVVLLLDELS